jgi:hypothetical protein
VGENGTYMFEFVKVLISRSLVAGKPNHFCFLYYILYIVTILHHQYNICNSYKIKQIIYILSVSKYSG